MPKDLNKVETTSSARKDSEIMTDFLVFNASKSRLLAVFCYFSALQSWCIRAGRGVIWSRVWYKKYLKNLKKMALATELLVSIKGRFYDFYSGAATIKLNVSAQ